jgi:multidrug efflux pump subunit AcrA (membrane-fusion protein)
MARISAWIVLAALLIAGCGRGGAPEESAQRLHPSVRVVAIESHLFRGGIEAPGQWKAASETVIQAPFDLIVDSIRVRPGDRVQRGEILGWWRTYESAAAVRGAQLLLEQARDSTSRNEARRAVRDAEASVVRVPIESPASGTVVRRQADDGSRLSAGSEALALVAENALVFEARIPGWLRSEVTPGLEASIDEGGDTRTRARVWTILPATAGDQSALVWLRPEAGNARPEIGRFGTASFVAAHPARALAVPDSAVVEDDLTGQHRIAIVDSTSRVAWIDVGLGAREGETRAVESAGLRPGMRVIVEGQRALLAGTVVSVEP